MDSALQIKLTGSGSIQGHLNEEWFVQKVNTHIPAHFDERRITEMFSEGEKKSQISHTTLGTLVN